LQDETSFIVPDFDPSDSPYFFELLTANGTDISAFVDGKLATVPEPPIPGIGVCLGEVCTETGADGTFTLQSEKEQDTYNLKFTDPNADDPARAFRYINKWNRSVVIESHKVNDVIVPEQHLNDTEIMLIEMKYEIDVDTKVEIGLFQGFLTLPFPSDISPIPIIFNYFDIIGVRLFDSEHNFYNTQDSIVLNFDGNFTKHFSPDPYYKNASISPGVGDSHNGLDYFVEIGNFVLLGDPNSIVSSLYEANNGELLIQVAFYNSSQIRNQFMSTYGHLSKRIIKLEENVIRGQIIALSGNTGGSATGRYPQLHFDLFEHSNKGSYHYDPFRCTIDFDHYPNNYWGSEYSFWTVDNIPQFPLVEINE